jgi:hypothetical protein
MENFTRAATAAQLASLNEVLPYGVLGYEVDTGLLKVGNGVTGWSGLSYLPVAVIASVDGLHLRGSNAVDGAVVDANGRLRLPGARQQTYNVTIPSSASTTAVHAAITLLATTQVVTTAITNPDCYRAVTITGAMQGASLTGNVVVTGTDLDGRVVTDTIALNNNATVVGVVPMATVTQIALPVRVTAADTVAIGSANVFGLDRLIAATSDVLYVERAASAATAWTREAPGTINAANSTFALGSVTANDRLRISYQSRYV